MLHPNHVQNPVIRQGEATGHTQFGPSAAPGLKSLSLNFSWIPPGHPALGKLSPGLYPWQVVSETGSWSLYTPTTNRGVKSPNPQPSACVIDWLSVSFKEEKYTENQVITGPTDDDIVKLLSESLRPLGIIPDYGCKQPGKNFYNTSYPLKALFSVEDRINLGFLAIGGNNDTINLNLTGSACALLTKKQWQFLLRFLDRLEATITRVDVAYDDYEGKKSVGTCLQMWKENQFTGRGSPPKLRCIHNPVFDDGSGSTAYIGSRSSGKQLRVYEKGKQLGDNASPWVRWELELRNKQRAIPLDVIDNPDQYFVGSYPALADFIVNVVACRIETAKRQVQISLDLLVESCKTGYGKLVYTLSELGNTSDQIIELLSRPGVPSRLVIPIPQE